jgi:hypothetical protein
MTNDLLSDEFQYTILELLIRNKSILDSLTKFQDSNSRVNRAIVKSVTHCGCIKINASKQDYSPEEDFDTIRKKMSTHVEGKLCKSCRDAIEKEIGINLFYLASICNILDLNMYDILIKELDRIKTLGNFSLR